MPRNKTFKPQFDALESRDLMTTLLGATISKGVQPAALQSQLSATTNKSVQPALNESRVTATMDNGVLRIVGTERADTINVRETGWVFGKQIAVDNCQIRINNQLKWSVPVADVKKIEVMALDGDDKVSLSDTSAVNIPSTIWGGKGGDTLRGGNGRDTIYGEEGINTIYGERGNDFIYGGHNVDFIFGGDGTDTIHGGAGKDQLYGERDIDTIYGDGDDDIILGGSGDDRLDGGGGNDTISGENGKDIIYGGTGNDTIHGGAGNDILRGEADNDIIFGDDGLDWLYGDADNDVLFGGAFADADHLYGGSGADLFLPISQEDTPRDPGVDDATVPLTSDGTKSWADDEVQKVAKGMAFLMEMTGNTPLMRLSNGGAFEIQRVTSLGPKTLGDNDSRGRIRITDLSFATSTSEKAEATIIHEVAHNWDEEMGSAAWKQWLGLSGWQRHNNGGGSLFPPAGYKLSSDGEWDYLASADNSFARDYGRTSPFEDWCTAWEAYKQHKSGNLKASDFIRLQSKINFIEQFMADRRG